jgi:hypothetical protein
MTELLKIRWQNRFDALEPSALIAFGNAAENLRGKLLTFDDEKLSALQGVFAENLLFVAGAKEILPWANGVVYLGKDRLAPSVFVPTNLRPNVPLDLFEKSLLAKFSAQKPFAVVENKIISIGKMHPISRKILCNAVILTAVVVASCRHTSEASNNA